MHSSGKCVILDCNGLESAGPWRSICKKRTYEASNAAKRQICTVLKELMTQKPLNRITVAEIMRGCGRRASNFYYHF